MGITRRLQCSEESTMRHGYQNRYLAILPTYVRLQNYDHDPNAYISRRYRITLNIRTFFFVSRDFSNNAVLVSLFVPNSRFLFFPLLFSFFQSFLYYLLLLTSLETRDKVITTQSSSGKIVQLNSRLELSRSYLPGSTVTARVAQSRKLRSFNEGTVGRS